MVSLANSVQMSFQRRYHPVGEQSDSIFSTFSVSHGELLTVQAKVFDAEPHALHQPQARPVEE
jgi:hypothetical protein